MFQFSGLGISLTKPHGEKMNVLFRATSLRPPVLPVDAPADADADAAADAACRRRGRSRGGWSGGGRSRSGC